MIHILHSYFANSSFQLLLLKWDDTLIVIFKFFIDVFYIFWPLYREMNHSMWCHFTHQQRPYYIFVELTKWPLMWYIITNRIEIMWSCIFLSTRFYTLSLYIHGFQKGPGKLNFNSGTLMYRSVCCMINFRC